MRVTPARLSGGVTVARWLERAIKGDAGALVAGGEETFA